MLGALTGIAAGGVVGLPAGLRAQGTPHKFKVGAAEVTILSDGYMTLPTGFLFPDQSPDEIEALHKANGQTFNGIRPEVNVTVIKLGSETVLIDTGGGPDFLPTLGKLPESLQAAGIAPESITRVIFTHAHQDHLWGVADALGGDTQFEKAQHVISGGERDYWIQDGIETRVSQTMQGFALGIQRRLRALADRLTIIAPGAEVMPGLALIDSGGHTPGHVSVVLRSQGQQLVIGGDALNHAIVSFAAPDWRWGSDQDKDRAIASRKRLLDQVTTERSLYVGYHLPWPGVGRVERNGTAYRFVPATA
jgi:glyoxylase-like metal-dependent hydrolase (beta-lactamase superfamily II)